MLLTKRFLLRLVFGLELCVFAGFYCFGSRGLTVLFRLGNENTKILHEMTALQEEIKALENEKKEWEQNAFYKEKFAREKLHMARVDDEVYMLEG